MDIDCGLVSLIAVSTGVFRTLWCGNEASWSWVAFNLKFKKTKGYGVYVHVLLCVFCVFHRVMCVCVMHDVPRSKGLVKCWAEEHSACVCVMWCAVCLWLWYGVPAFVVCGVPAFVWCVVFLLLCDVVCLHLCYNKGCLWLALHCYSPTTALSASYLFVYVGLSDLEQTVPQCVHVYFPPPIFIHFSTVHQCDT